MYEIIYNKLSQKDYDNLEGSQKIFVNKGLAKIQQDGMAVGEALHGNLSGCNKLKNKKLGLRIVFTQRKRGIEIIEIVAIGKRSDKEVYVDAEYRLTSQKKQVEAVIEEIINIKKDHGLTHSL